MKRNSLRGNPLFGSMIAARVGHVGNVSHSCASDILIQPIIPSLVGMTSYRRRSSLPVLDKRRLSQSNVPNRSTKIAFQNWRRKDDETIRNNERQQACRHTTKNQLLRHRRSKFGFVFSSCGDLIRRYPQIRPSVCSVATGVVLILCGTLCLVVPQIRSNFPMWVGLLLTLIGGVATVVGIIGFKLESLKLQRRARSNATSMTQYTPTKIVTGEPPKMETVIEEKISPGIPRPLTRDLPPRRKLPDSPRGTKGIPPPSFYSSEPDLTPVKRGKPHDAFPQPHNVTRYEKFEQINFPVTEMKYDVIKLEKGDDVFRGNPLIGNEIFERFRDPLLFRAITRIKYQCDCEFHRGKMERCDVSDTLRHQCDVESLRHHSEAESGRGLRHSYH
uniref:uncharacterized protein LOC100181557 isoform X1 n=1 Tax=Ciona intestinalis TaxID=7719 RepID=UPI000EF50727|nr:uncharacterized protein LOC100181557 isoform X1 [Ciona intestinalis]|eukprot:XP_026693678.1 uncharacterized protein LOC100181557 isoform X1 [Ciona intestinalis]